MNFDFNVWTSESDIYPLVYPRLFVAVDTESFYAVGWARWYRFGGMWDDPRAKQKGVVPVPKDSPMYEAMVAYDKARKSTSPEEQKRLMDRVFDIAAENVWNISIGTPPPQPTIVKKNLRNVPRNALVGNLFFTPSNAGLETYFFEGAKDSPGAIADTKSAIVTARPKPGSVSLEAKKPAWTAGSIVKWGVIAVTSLALLMLAVRHPFIGRRLLIMVPTMAAISVIVFVIIQLPPGDFLTTRIVQLQETGDATADRQIEDLRQMFRFEDPLWKQYTRWMGLNWFFTYQPGDAGLLQGNLGRSMETTQPVNDILGDRMLLTVLMSLATIVFTWATALPIGIYSAVRQYSVGDHILTLIGFIGMCVPAFLLALVLMAISNKSGLFSPEFATQPEWDWPKIWDLTKHMWIPVVVLGVGGTAGMIRVMRANLLDELKKPYVTTALAKGVRPTKLLIKYPVRLALNPFVSGVGHLFPQLVSGGAIVSMVLALPTVGPLLLTALQAEDMYLAGSMLMILSLLGIIGTLVSDLLLLWLDPRIRVEGGTR
jgi:ABC-type dipeptide/oligopeptide/nickel transport system permease component